MTGKEHLSKEAQLMIPAMNVETETELIRARERIVNSENVISIKDCIKELKDLPSWTEEKVSVV